MQVTALMNLQCDYMAQLIKKLQNQVAASFQLFAQRVQLVLMNYTNKVLFDCKPC